MDTEEVNDAQFLEFLKRDLNLHVPEALSFSSAIQAFI